MECHWCGKWNIRAPFSHNNPKRRRLQPFEWVNYFENTIAKLFKAFHGFCRVILIVWNRLIFYIVCYRLYTVSQCIVTWMASLHTILILRDTQIEWKWFGHGISAPIHIIWVKISLFLFYNVLFINGNERCFDCKLLSRECVELITIIGTFSLSSIDLFVI